MIFRKSFVLTIFAALLGMAVLTGCSPAKSAEKSAGAGKDAESSQTAPSSETAGPKIVTKASELDYSDMFTERDLSTAWSASAASKILLDGNEIRIVGEGVSVSGNTACIGAGGTYYISGTLADGQIVVDVSEQEKVQLVLDGADITCGSSACILIKNADKVFITLADGSSNYLSDTEEEYVQADESMNVDAVIFSKTDLVLNGTGSLTVEAGYQDAIVSKDDLKITGGTYEINAANKGIVGKDSLRIRDGEFSIVSQNDALQSDNEEKPGKGYIYIEGGSFCIMTGDDAVHAATALVLREGEIDILQCYEGFEADTIDIEGGAVSIICTDDGFNASLSGSEDAADDVGGGGRGGNAVQEDCYIRVAGGSVYVKAEGDGLDSNGSILMEGGNMIVDGPVSDGNSSLDAGTEILISKGTLMCCGSAGMAKAPSEQSTQHSIYYISPEPVPAGTEVGLADGKGNVLCSFTPSGNWSCLTFSTPKIKEGTYTLKVGEDRVQIEVSSVVTVLE